MTIINFREPEKDKTFGEAVNEIGKKEVSKNLELLDWACENCGLVPLKFDGRRMYVIDDNNLRHRCSHPLEYLEVEKHLGPHASDQLLEERIRYYEDCLCSSCFEISLLDPDIDPMVCLKCGEGQVRRGIEMANQACPRCQNGRITSKPRDMSFIEEITRSIHSNIA